VFAFSCASASAADYNLHLVRFMAYATYLDLRDRAQA